MVKIVYCDPVHYIVLYLIWFVISWNSKQALGYEKSFIIRNFFIPCKEYIPYAQADGTELKASTEEL